MLGEMLGEMLDRLTRAEHLCFLTTVGTPDTHDDGRTIRSEKTKLNKAFTSQQGPRYRGALPPLPPHKTQIV